MSPPVFDDSSDIDESSLERRAAELVDRGIVRLSEGDVDGAVSELQHAAALDPNSDVAREVSNFVAANLDALKKVITERKGLEALAAKAPEALQQVFAERQRASTDIPLGDAPIFMGTLRVESDFGEADESQVGDDDYEDIEVSSNVEGSEATKAEEYQAVKSSDRAGRGPALRKDTVDDGWEEGLEEGWEEDEDSDRGDGSNSQLPNAPNHVHRPSAKKVGGPNLDLAPEISASFRGTEAGAEEVTHIGGPDGRDAGKPATDNDDELTRPGGSEGGARISSKLGEGALDALGVLADDIADTNGDETTAERRQIAAGAGIRMPDLAELAEVDTRDDRADWLESRKNSQGDGDFDEAPTNWREREVASGVAVRIRHPSQDATVDLGEVIVEESLRAQSEIEYPEDAKTVDIELGSAGARGFASLGLNDGGEFDSETGEVPTRVRGDIRQRDLPVDDFDEKTNERRGRGADYSKLEPDAKLAASGGAESSAEQVTRVFNPAKSRDDLAAKFRLEAESAEGTADAVKKMMLRASSALEASRAAEAVIAAEEAWRVGISDESGQKTLHRFRDQLLEIYQEFLGSQGNTPYLLIGMEALPNIDIDSRAAFLASRIDGLMSQDELLDVAGMPTLESSRYLCLLCVRGVISFRQE